MSKQHANPKTLAQAKKVIDYHASEIEEMAHDVGKKMMQDQAEWLDAQMKDLLPPRLYKYGLLGEKEREIGEYLQKHEIRIVFIADSMALRIMIGQRVHSQFLPTFTVDGEPVNVEASGFMPDAEKN